MSTMAKVFRNGASQAVRLPKEFRFDSESVCIKRIGSAVLIFPPGRAWELMEESLGAGTEDFLARRDQPAKPQRRRRI